MLLEKLMISRVVLLFCRKLLCKSYLYFTFVSVHKSFTIFSRYLLSVIMFVIPLSVSFISGYEPQIPATSPPKPLIEIPRYDLDCTLCLNSAFNSQLSDSSSREYSTMKISMHQIVRSKILN